MEAIFLAVLIFFSAVLYASVGHGGASAYLAAMALVGLSPEVMRPAALALNILVSFIACIKYYRVGAFSWNLFWPFAVASVPFAYVGGMMTLPGEIYKPVLGLVLVYAAWYSFRFSQQPLARSAIYPYQWLLFLLGTVLGLLSGLVGVGGGIFLSPLLLMFRWAEVRVISGIAAAFIFVNSISGLLGVYHSGQMDLPVEWFWWALAAVVGGVIGAEYGSKHFSNPAIRKLLAVVLVIAGVKMIWSGLNN